MPYYAVGDYYGRGDYYRGDPGVFDFLKKAVKTVAGVAGSFIPGPIGTVARLVSGGAGAVRAPKELAAGGVVSPVPAFFGMQQPLAGFAEPGGFDPLGKGAAKRRALGLMPRKRMNPMNVRALRRASRRIDSFARVTRRALKHTPFVLVRRGARGRGGSPGVITRSEAARALKR